MGTPMYLHNSMAACSAVHINGWLLCRYGVGGVVEMWDPLSFFPLQRGEEEGGNTVLYTTQCWGTGSVPDPPVQWPKATELVHSRIYS